MTPSDETQFTHHVPEPCTDVVEVVYVDDHVLVVNKPSGLLSVPGRLLKDSVLHRMLYEYPESRVVHRLDLDTSGLQVISQSIKATSDLNRQFRERRVEKRYIADVWGELEQESGSIELPIRPDPDNRPRQVVDWVSGKSALTRFRLLEQEAGISRVELAPVTGRSHQLRVHMAETGHPILGCDLYAHEQALKAADRLLLHAAELGFSHPATGEPCWFTSPIPWD